MVDAVVLGESEGTSYVAPVKTRNQGRRRSREGFPVSPIIIKGT